MAFSSAPNFIHFPTSISISISISPPNANSNYKLNAASSCTTNYYLPRPLTAKPRGPLCVKCNGDGEGSAPPPEKSDGGNEKNSLICKLYKGVKNKDIATLYDVIADQHPLIFNSYPSSYFLQIFRTLQKRWNVFANTIYAVILSVQLIKEDESMWDKVKKWEKGVSIHDARNLLSGYSKMFSSNLETRMDPFRLELNRLGFSMLMKQKKNWNWNWMATKQSRVVLLCVGFFVLLLSLLFIHFYVR